MCGLSGYHGLEHVELGLRVSIFVALGEGSDRRGGHAAGLAAFSKGDTAPFIRKKLGDAMSYDDECLAFVDLGSRHETLLLHTRYATTEARSVDDAHPFTIVRNGAPVLHGMHNGIIYNARDMAEKHGRPYTVDSLEMFEILTDALASNDFSTFSKLQGYGVIVWATADEPECVHFCRLTDDGDLVIAALKGGGIMWGSTKSILQDGLKAGGLEVAHFYKLDTGRIYKAFGGELYASDHKLSIRSRDYFSADYYASRGLSGTSYSSMADIPRTFDNTYEELQEAAIETFGCPRQGARRSRSFLVDEDDDELPITQDVAEE